MQVGTTKDQGLYIKPSAAVHPGGISRRDPTTIQYIEVRNLNLQSARSITTDSSGITAYTLCVMCGARV